MPFCFIVQNFTEIRKSVDELWPKKLFSRWRPPPSWIFNNFNFWSRDYSICYMYRISSKSDDYFTEIWRFNDFRNGNRPPSWVLNICLFFHLALVDMPFCFLIQNFAEIGQSVDELWPKKWFSRWRPPPSWMLKNFNFWITWLSSGWISDVVYQISSKSDDFSLRYGDFTIFKMAVVRHLGF